MKKRRRLFSFLLLNVIVSATSMWVVLNLWFGEYLVTDGNDSSGGITFNSAGDSQNNATDQESQDGISSAQAAGQLEITRIVGAGDLESERVEIHHVGESEISLEGWRLRDEDGNEYLIPTLTMFGQGSITLFTKAGVDTVVELYWGLVETVWQTGEVATLLDPDGNPQATYTVP